MTHPYSSKIVLCPYQLLDNQVDVFALVKWARVHMAVEWLRLHVISVVDVVIG